MEENINNEANAPAEHACQQAQPQGLNFQDVVNLLSVLVAKTGTGKFEVDYSDVHGPLMALENAPLELNVKNDREAKKFTVTVDQILTTRKPLIISTDAAKADGAQCAAV